MNVATIPKLFPALPDAAAEQPGVAASRSGGFGSEFAAALAGASDALDRAGASERAFAAGTGGLQRMILDRAQADVALSIASSAASRTTAALSTILAMQI